MTVRDVAHVVNNWFSHGSRIPDIADVAAMGSHGGSRFESMSCVSYVFLGCNKLVCGSVWHFGCSCPHAYCSEEAHNMPKLSELEAGPRAKEKCAANLGFGIHEGVSKLFNLAINEVWDYMISPTAAPQRAPLDENHEMRLPDTVDRFARCARPQHRHRWKRVVWTTLRTASVARPPRRACRAATVLHTRHNSFLICLRMLRPVRLDAVWEPNHFGQNRYLAGLLRCGRYSHLDRPLRTDVTDLIEGCKATCLYAREIGGGGGLGMRTLYPTRVPMGMGCGNTLRTSHTPLAKSCMCCAAIPAAMSSMCICTQLAVGASAEPALAREILMPKAPCGVRRSKCPVRPSWWQTRSSAGMALRTTSPPSTGRS